MFLLRKTQIDFKSKKIDEKEVNFKYFYQLGNFTEYLAINPFYNNPNEANEKKSIYILQQISDKKYLYEQISFDNEIIQKHIINVSKNLI